jgi:membrane protein implicated in regulation of membrane protease activity
MTWIYYAAKAIIALEIIIAGAKSLIVPLIAIAAGAINLYLTQVNQVQYLTANDATQLIIVGIIAFCITFIVRSIRK